MQFIFPPIGSPADYFSLPRIPMDDALLVGYRAYSGESSGNHDHIDNVGNIVLNRSSWEPQVQALFDSHVRSLAKNHFGKSLPFRYSLTIAQNITPNPSLKVATGTPTAPLVLLSEFLVMTTLTDKMVYLLFVVCYSLCIFSWLIKKHPDI
jgi:hypothetical protein